MQSPEPLTNPSRNRARSFLRGTLSPAAAISVLTVMVVAYLRVPVTTSCEMTTPVR
jgi:hypothetical protein